MLSCAMLLEWLGASEAARALTAAIDQALQDPAARTGDLGGRGTTSGFGEAVARAL
jgi:isocitrate/isopropylmalate dehydrogenase